MAQLIVPDVCRYTIEGSYLGAPCFNILDTYLPADGLMTRPEAVAAMAEVVLDAWSDFVLPVMKSQYTAEAVSWLDLDSATGTTGSTTRGSTADGPYAIWPKTGEIGGEAYTGAVATLVRKRSVATRGQRQGRMFLPPPGEADIAGNTIGAPYLAALNTALGEVVYTLANPPTPIGSAALVTVHDPAGAAAPTWTEVTELSARDRVSTQRRRNR